MAARTTTRKTRSKQAGTTGTKTATAKPAARKRATPRASTVKLDGQLRIGQAAALKTRLGKALEKKNRIRIDASGVEKIDTSALQVLTAFFIKARERSVDVTWHKPAEPLLAAAALLGLSSPLELDGLEPPRRRTPS